MEASFRPGTLEYFGVDPQTCEFTMVDLFAGAGGLSLGLSWTGFCPIAAVEVDNSAAETYAANFGSHVLRDGTGKPFSIEEVDFGAYAGKVDLLVGGPPCQGFSQLGTRSEADPRNRLWREYLRAIEQIRPRVFLMENVPPILKSQEGHETMMRSQELGYHITAGVVSADSFGVPQKRKRAFFIGTLDSTATLPSPPRYQALRDVRWAFAGLPLQPDEENWHISRKPTATSLERYRAVPEGGNRFDLMQQRPDITPPYWLKKRTGSTDVFGRLWWERPALTIQYLRQNS